MLLAEQLSAFSAIDLPIRSIQSVAAHGLGANIIRAMPLPMRPCNNIVWVYARWLGRPDAAGRRSWRDCRRWSNFVGFKNIKTLELLIQNRERLEFLCFYHLRSEPIFNLILSDFFEVFVHIVEMSLAELA